MGSAKRFYWLVNSVGLVLLISLFQNCAKDLPSEANAGNGTPVVNTGDLLYPLPGPGGAPNNPTSPPGSFESGFGPFQYRTDSGGTVTLSGDAAHSGSMGVRIQSGTLDLNNPSLVNNKVYRLRVWARVRGGTGTASIKVDLYQSVSSNGSTNVQNLTPAGQISITDTNWQPYELAFTRSADPGWTLGMILSITAPGLAIDVDDISLE